jgi:hypothetical protein
VIAHELNHALGGDHGPANHIDSPGPTWGEGADYSPEGSRYVVKAAGLPTK